MTNEIITGKQWDNYAKTVETKTLKKGKRSYTWVTISNNVAHRYLIESRGDTLIVKPGWRQAMRDFNDSLNEREAKCH